MAEHDVLHVRRIWRPRFCCHGIRRKETICICSALVFDCNANSSMLDDEYFNRVGSAIAELHGIGHGTYRRCADRVLCDCAVVIDSVG